jgi:hypothetical protein
MNDDGSRLPRMWKAQPMRVKLVARCAGKCRLPGNRCATLRIERLAHQRMSGRREVDPDLVRPPGPDLDLDERAVAALLDESNPGESALTGGVHSVHGAEKRMRHRADGEIDHRLARRERSPHDASIPALHLPFPAKDESPARFPCQREEDDSRSAASEAMEGRGPRISAAHAVKERVLDEAATGQRRQSRRLRDGEDIPILVQYGEARGCRRLAPGRAVPHQDLSRRELSTGFRGDSLEQDQAALDPRPPFERRRMRITFAEVSEERPTAGRLAETLAIDVAVVEGQSYEGLLPTT